MKNKETRFPRYALVPLAMTIALNMLTYYASRLINGGMAHYDFTLPVDNRIPFIPGAVLIYVLAFVSWGVGFLVLCREARADCYRFFAGEQAAKILCCVIFLVLPTTMARPSVPGTDLFSRVTRLIYRLDTPDNLLPSIHCLENWVLLRGTLRSKKVSRGYQVGFLIFTLLVFASTLLVKQHLVVDVAAAVAVGELGIWLADRRKLWRVYEALERKWNR